MYPRAEGVKRQLADGNAHAAGAQIAQAENPLAVGGDNDRHVRERRLVQRLAHPSLVRSAEVKAARLAIDV